MKVLKQAKADDLALLNDTLVESTETGNSLLSLETASYAIGLQLKSQCNESEKKYLSIYSHSGVIRARAFSSRVIESLFQYGDRCS